MSAIVRVITPNAGLSRLQFRQRFTRAELIAIDTSSDPLVVSIREDFKVAQFIRVDDANTVAALTALAGAGVIATERIAEILS
jgi:hypothetical protein